MHDWGIQGRVDAAADAAIRDVVTVYCRFMDNFDDDAVLELFAPDGEWWRHGEPPLRGRSEIGAWLRTRDRGVKGRHVATNILIEMEGPARAKVTSYFTVLKAAPDGAPVPVSMGEYHDIFRLDQGRWRIARRETHRVFRAG
jgi:ketosteroid isomerase-like protein